MASEYPRTICVRLSVGIDGRVQMKKVWEENEAGKVIKENAEPRPIPSDLNTLVKGHNTIGVLVSNPTCFIVGGTQICI